MFELPYPIQFKDKGEPYQQSEPCDMFGYRGVCLERVVGSGAGLEDLWAKIRDENISGELIEKHYWAGDPLARRLYGNSAYGMAHMIFGVGHQILGIKLNAESTVVIGHGGAFNFKEYGKAVLQVLEHNGGLMPNGMRKTRTDAGMHGAAVATILKDSCVYRV